MLLLDERDLRRDIAEFVAHHHAERNHQGIGNELTRPLKRTDRQGVIRRRQRMAACSTSTIVRPRSSVGENDWRSSRTVRGPEAAESGVDDSNLIGIGR